MEFAKLGRRNDEPVSPAELLDGLLRVAQIVRLHLNEWLGHYELNDGRHAVLTKLARSGPEGCSQAELAEQLGQSESNISTLIERMQRDGLVTRLRSQADRRKRVLSIAPEGRAALESVEAHRSAWATRLLGSISELDRPRLFAMLHQLGISLEPTATRHSPALSIFPASHDDCESVVSLPAGPAEDPESPQFALRKMLLALSNPAMEVSSEKEAA